MRLFKGFYLLFLIVSYFDLSQASAGPTSEVDLSTILEENKSINKLVVGCGKKPFNWKEDDKTTPKGSFGTRSSRNEMSEREVVLDTETTGLEPRAGHRLVEIGCIELVDRVPTGRQFHKYLNPERPVPREASQIHGLTDEFLQDKPLFKDVAGEFLDFVRDATLVIHNAPFDMKFLNAELTILEASLLEMKNVVDTLQIARKKFPGAPANLDALCRRFKIDNSHRTNHGALLDSELLIEVYLELTGGRQLSFQWDGQGKSAPTGQDAKEKIHREARPHEASAPERDAHDAFMKGIKKPLWEAS